jgi:DNA uptake protein ComE-like DNA-binding protein
VSQSLPNREQGFALILVLWLALALAAVSICFGHVALLGHRTQSGVVAALQCRQTIRAAGEYVKALLGTVEDGQMPDLEDEDTQKVVVGDGAFWLVAPIWSDSSELNTATKDMLQGLPGVTEAIAAAIVDWRDQDSEAEAYGAEDETYSRKDIPYRAKNGDFESVDELLLVEGVDEELLYGKDRNQNGVIDPWEDDDSSVDDADLGIWHLVTVSSAEPNTQSNSQGGQQSGKTNVTETQSLRSYLSQTFGAEKANQAVSAAPYGSVLEFGARSGLTREEFKQVEANLTASDEDVVKGLVNVNVAPRAVLRCLPGVGDDGAEKIVSYRTANSEELTSVSWLLDALGTECAKELGPYVTVKTYQISADVVAVANRRRAVRRVRLVFDLSSGSPVLVSRRDLSNMAWPLEQDLWDELGSDPLADDSE